VSPLALEPPGGLLQPLRKSETTTTDAEMNCPRIFFIKTPSLISAPKPAPA
jgi:hypothetical protein